MMIYPLLILFAIIFFELFVLLRMSKDAMAIITLSQESMRVLVAETGDDEREVLIRRGAAEILKATVRFALKFLSIGMVLCLLFLLTVMQLPDLREAMLDSFVSPVVIAILTTAIVCYAAVRKAILARLRDRA